MNDESWTRLLRRTLQSYDEPLLRLVTGKLCRPRNHWPAEELLERSAGTLANAAVLDRRLKDQGAAGRLALALIAHSRQPRWPVGSLIEMLVILGEDDPSAVVISLLKAGLLYPDLFPRGLEEDGQVTPPRGRLRNFESWITQAHPPVVFAHPAVTARALSLDFPWPDGPEPIRPSGSPVVREADGLEWLLRLAAIWQQVNGSPLRRTQQGDFFKRDLDRLETDPLLSQEPSDSLAPVPDPALFTVALGLAVGVLQEVDGELRAGVFPDAWRDGLAATIAELWSALPRLESWNAVSGWKIADAPGNPYPAAHLLALLVLSRLPEGSFASPHAMERWIDERHPFWSPSHADSNGQERSASKKSAKQTAAVPDRGIARFLLGVAYPLKLLQAAKDADGAWVVRLSPLGRWVLGLGEAPPPSPAYPQTVLVQPNLEMLAYRQGLTPELILRLGRFATWKGLGAACTLQLEPHSVYGALEAGESLSSIVQTLERHGMKDLPAAVLDSLRTWSNKRERLSVYAAAALFEFPGAAELTDALARGLPAVRLSDRLAIVANEDAIDYRHFRLTGTRDYCLPAEKCVDVEADGVTLSIDLGRSDLLLETEVQGFAQPSSRPGPPGKKLYGLTAASLAAARENGLTLPNLEAWFRQRTGLPISPAAHLLLTAADQPPADLRRQLILHVSSPEIADGLQQWPRTRDLIHTRLGPTALVVAEKDVEALQERSQELGLRLFHGEG